MATAAAELLTHYDFVYEASLARRAARGVGVAAPLGRTGDEGWAAAVSAAATALLDGAGRWRDTR